MRLVNELTERASVDKTCPRHGAYRSSLSLISGRQIESQCPKCAKEEFLSTLGAGVSPPERKPNKAELPKRFQLSSFDGYQAATEGQQRALKFSQEYANRFKSRLDVGGCMVFCGTCGTGKTHLACAIANTIAEQGHSVQFTSAMEIIQNIKETYRDESRSERAAIGAYSKPDLLIIDEVGQQYGTDAERMLIFHVVNKRYNDMRPMLLISNLDEDALSKFIGETTFDRLQENGGAIVAFNWESFRRRRTQRQPKN